MDATEVTRAWVFKEVHELPTEAAARRWRGRVT